MKKSKYIFTGLTIAVILAWNVTYSYAAPTQSDLDEKQNQIDQTKKDLENVKEEKSEVAKQVEELTIKISDYQSKIDDLEDEIQSLNKSIKETEEKIKQKEEEYKENKELLDARMVVLYEAGEVTFLDVLLNSEGLVDFISNYYMVTELANADTELLEKIEKEKNEIETIKATLEENKKKEEAAKNSQEEAANALKNAKAQKDKYAAELSEEEKELQAELEKFQKEKASIAAELERIANENKVNDKDNISNTPSKSGYISPIAGLTKANITCGYYGYSGHTGVDFSGGLYGKTVRAVKAGTVVKSTTSYGSIPNYGSNGTYVGSYSSYGEYIIIDHHDGTMTLYAHGKPGSRMVSPGQYVSQGQAIMQVGNTGNVLPRPTASDPLRGTHLHFEVRVNGRCVNPTPYLP